MTDPLSHSGSTERRLDRVETDVSALSSAMSGVQAEVRSFGQSLNTIIDTLKTRDHEQAESARASKVNPLALGGVLVTIILSLIAGSWSLGAESARSAVTDDQRATRLETIERRAEELERRVYNLKVKSQ